VKQFARARSTVTGALLNGVNPKSARLSYGRKSGAYRYVQYDYDEKRPEQASRWRQVIDRLGRAR
jgi:tyrosine-protein kinase Etk/Wzc